MIGIYKITNLEKNKCYIGQSNNIKYRWKRHKEALNLNKHFNIYLQRAWNKYGKDNFKFTILEECDLESLDDREVYWIEYYKCANIKYGYNMAIGGRNGSNLNDEAKRKISETLKGHIVSEETKSKIREKRKYQKNTRKGQKCTEEQRQRMSESAKGKKLSDDTKKKVSQNNARYWLGKKRSEETIQKILKTKKEKGIKPVMTAETLRKIREANKNKPSMAEKHKEIIPLVREMMSQGIMQKDIAIKFNMNYSTLRNIVRKCIRNNESI